VVNTGDEQASGGGAHNNLYGQESRKVSLLRQQLKKYFGSGRALSPRSHQRVKQENWVIADAIGALAVLANAVEQITALGMPSRSNRLSSCGLRSLVQ
jgi:hypothetical protein